MREKAAGGIKCYIYSHRMNAQLKPEGLSERLKGSQDKETQREQPLGSSPSKALTEFMLENGKVNS